MPTVSRHNVEIKKWLNVYKNPYDEECKKVPCFEFDEISVWTTLEYVIETFDDDDIRGIRKFNVKSKEDET